MSRGLLRFGQFMRRDLWLVLGVLGSLGLATGLGLIGPYLTGAIVTTVQAADRVRQLHHVGGPGLRAVPLLALAMIGAAAGTGLFTFVRGWLSELVAQRSMYRARQALYEHFESQSFDYFDRNETGQLLSRTTGDVDVLRRLISRAAPASVAALLQFVGTAIILFRLDWRLALIALCVVPVYVRTMLLMTGKMRPASWRVQQELANITSVCQECLSSIRVVKAFVRGDFEEARFARANQGYMDRSLQVAAIQSRYQPILSQLPTVGTVVLLAYGGTQVIAGHLTLGLFVAFNAYVLNLLGPLSTIGMMLNLVAQASASADRIFELLDGRGQVVPPADPAPVGTLRGQVRFEEVWARYGGSGEWVLQDVDLTVEPGECLALVGMTGSGKTTLVNLIPRFYDPERGRVLVDGQDVRDLDLTGLRRQIGFVLQDPFLFSASLEDNIRYGRPDAGRETVAAAAAMAHIAEFIESLPDGYATTVGERGLGLSGGQKQRVAIARALVTDPRILVLDDATSSVDAENEHLIWDALRRLLGGRTSFIIAHRLQSVMFADRIAVLDGGRIAEIGTHHELLRRSELYRTIHDLQLAPGERARALAGGGLLA